MTENDIETWAAENAERAALIGMSVEDLIRCATHVANAYRLAGTRKTPRRGLRTGGFPAGDLVYGKRRRKWSSQPPSQNHATSHSTR